VREAADAAFAAARPGVTFRTVHETAMGVIARRTAEWGLLPVTADEALDAARGHPGLADAWLRDGGIALRREVAADLGKLARGELGAVEAAQRWTASDDAAMRLRHAADLALAEAASLTTPARMRKLAAWFDAANRTRELLQTTVRADLALTELLLAWVDGRA
jgi:DNA polymerase-3 subunit delta'